jgi:hypothetical protein
MSRRRRKVPCGRVPGVPGPSTEKTRAASRVAGWKSGKYARVVTLADVLEQRISMIESRGLASDAERERIRNLQLAIEFSADPEPIHYSFLRSVLVTELRELVLAIILAKGRRPEEEALKS